MSEWQVCIRELVLAAQGLFILHHKHVSCTYDEPSSILGDKDVTGRKIIKFLFS